MVNKWSKEIIASEILSMYASGEDLSHSGMIVANGRLLRAAIRYFGSWEAAVTFAGLDYNQFRKYQSWTPKRIIARIQELHGQGTDLSWGHIIVFEPQLASAATRVTYFGTWREAVEAAGLDYDSIRRYRVWNNHAVIQMVRDLHADGKSLNSKSMQNEETSLITAGRRRFESWPDVLTAAGLDYRGIVRRAPFKRGLGRRQSERTSRSLERTKTKVAVSPLEGRHNKQDS